MSEPIANPGRVWMYVVVGLAIVWMIGLALFLPGPPKTLENSGLSTAAVYDWSPVDMNDQPVPFSKFKGKAVFLNFWATWCPPCLREMPSIVKLANNPRLRDKNIEFICISRDASTEVVREFVADKNWPMTILRADTLPTAFASDGMPTTFVIAPDGQIVGYEPGPADWSEPHVVDLLEKLGTTAPARDEQALSPSDGARNISSSRQCQPPRQGRRQPVVGIRRTARALSAIWNPKKVGLPGRSQRSGIGRANFAGGLALMAKCTTNSRLGQLGTLFCIGRVGDRTDDELLQWVEYAARRGRNCLRGTGGAAWGDDPRRLPASLRDSHDVDDAFQATFLVLFRRSGSIRNRAAVGGWLHRVALRLRLRARTESSVAARPNGCWLRRRLRTLSGTRSNEPKSEPLCMRSSIGSPPPTDQRRGVLSRRADPRGSRRPIPLARGDRAQPARAGTRSATRQACPSRPGAWLRTARDGPSATVGTSVFAEVCREIGFLVL